MQDLHFLVETLLDVAAQQNKGKEKMQCTDSLFKDSVRSYKRPRQPAPEQNAHGSLKIRERTGWEHGIMIDGNRRWKCRYCYMVGRSDGVTSLKHHVAGGSGRVRACPSAPKDVSNEMKRLLDSKRQKPRKRTGQKGAVVQPAMATTSKSKNSVPLTTGVLCSTLSDWTEGSMTPHNMETDYEENSAFPSSSSFKLHMTRLVDMMLSAAEVLRVEEQSTTSKKIGGV